jgi:hypothetical protein
MNMLSAPTAMLASVNGRSDSASAVQALLRWFKSRWAQVCSFSGSSNLTLARLSIVVTPLADVAVVVRPPVQCSSSPRPAS